MQKYQKVLIGVGTGVIALIVVAAFVGPVIYRDFIAAPAASAPSLSADAGLVDAAENGDTGLIESDTPLDPAALAGEWVVAGPAGSDPGASVAGYRVDEVLNGTDVTVTGRTNAVEGALTIEHAEGTEGLGDDGSGMSLTAAAFTVDVASIETDNPSRDDYFRNRAMRVSEFATATFTLTEAVEFTAVPASGEVISVEATGDLTLAGSVHQVTAAIEVRSDGTVTEIAGAIPITFADFGIEAPQLGFVQVEHTGFIEFQLTAERATP